MRLIDADALIRELQSIKVTFGSGNGLIEGGLEIAISTSHAQPTVEPEQRWIPVTERLPEDNVPVNVTWVNRAPEPYYADIKDKPFTATGVYFQGKWYWYSAVIEDILAEYGRSEWDEIEEEVNNGVEVLAWMPLPEPYEEETKE